MRVQEIRIPLYFMGYEGCDAVQCFNIVAVETSEEYWEHLLLLTLLSFVYRKGCCICGFRQ